MFGKKDSNLFIATFLILLVSFLSTSDVFRQRLSAQPSQPSSLTLTQVTGKTIDSPSSVSVPFADDPRKDYLISRLAELTTLYYPYKISPVLTSKQCKELYKIYLDASNVEKWLSNYRKSDPSLYRSALNLKYEIFMKIITSCGDYKIGDYYEFSDLITNNIPPSISLKMDFVRDLSRNQFSVTPNTCLPKDFPNINTPTEVFPAPPSDLDTIINVGLLSVGILTLAGTIHFALVPAIGGCITGAGAIAPTSGGVILTSGAFGKAASAATLSKAAGILGPTLIMLMQQNANAQGILDDNGMQNLLNQLQQLTQAQITAYNEAATNLYISLCTATNQDPNKHLKLCPEQPSTPNAYGFIPEGSMIPRTHTSNACTDPSFVRTGVGTTVVPIPLKTGLGTYDFVGVAFYMPGADLVNPGDIDFDDLATKGPYGFGLPIASSNALAGNPQDYTTYGQRHWVEKKTSGVYTVLTDATKACQQSSNGKIYIPFYFRFTCGGWYLQILEYDCAQRTATPVPGLPWVGTPSSTSITYSDINQALTDLRNGKQPTPPAGTSTNPVLPPVGPVPTKCSQNSPCDDKSVPGRACANQNQYCSNCNCLNKKTVSCPTAAGTFSSATMICSTNANCDDGKGGKQQCDLNTCACPAVTPEGAGGSSLGKISATGLAVQSGLPQSAWSEYLTIDASDASDPNVYTTYKNTLTNDDISATYGRKPFRILSALDQSTGNQVTYTYDAQGNPQSIQDTQGNSGSYQYNAQTNKLSSLTLHESSFGADTLYTYSYFPTLSPTFEQVVSSVQYKIPPSSTYSSAQTYDARYELTQQLSDVLVPLQLSKTTLQKNYQSVGGNSFLIDSTTTFTLGSYTRVDKITYAYNSQNQISKTVLTVSLNGAQNPSLSRTFDYSYHSDGRMDTITMTTSAGVFTYTYQYGQFPASSTVPSNNLWWMTDVVDKNGNSVMGQPVYDLEGLF